MNKVPWLLSAIAVFLKCALVCYAADSPSVSPAPGSGSQSIQTQANKLSRIVIYNPEFKDIYPVFQKHYLKYPFGKAVLLNRDVVYAESLRVSLFVSHYMDLPTPCIAPSRLGPGREAEIAFLGLFNSSVLGESEATLAPATILVDCLLRGIPQHFEYSIVLRILDRNAMSWEDDRSVAAFITAKDPTIQKFAKNIIGSYLDSKSGRIPRELQAAVAVHETLREYGLRYVVDPNTPYSDNAENSRAVDFIQFPQQTLEYKAGDCDDLSILYCALLEAIGVNTALITVPNHIYMAVSLDMKPMVTRTTFPQASNFIFLDEDTWLPIEVTDRSGGFSSAWEKGYRQWQDNSSIGKAALFDVHDAWNVFEPVGFSSSVVPLNAPDRDRIAKACKTELSRIAHSQIKLKEAELRESATGNRDDMKNANKLAVLYAQWGLFDDAQQELSRLVDKDYLPAVLNMANLMHLKQDYQNELYYYRLAYKKQPDNPRIEIGLARAYYYLGKHEEAQILYKGIEKKAPELASQYSYLGTTANAATRSSENISGDWPAFWEE